MLSSSRLVISHDILGLRLIMIPKERSLLKMLWKVRDNNVNVAVDIVAKACTTPPRPRLSI